MTLFISICLPTVVALAAAPVAMEAEEAAAAEEENPLHSHRQKSPFNKLTKNARSHTCRAFL